MSAAFHGPLTYAALMFEHVDWSQYDIVGIDHYRNSKVEAHYAERIRPYLDLGKPVVNADFGHSPYRGDNIRDEDHQAHQLIKILKSSRPKASPAPSSGPLPTPG